MQRDPRLRFENFIVGSANRLAWAAARAVAETPGAVYNPLFIYRGSGLGKTHLMSAVGNHIADHHPGVDVRYASTDDVVTELHAAVARGDIEAMREAYGRTDVLLLDDVQFLTGHRETQTELLRVINGLQTSGKQVVLTSDRPPVEIADVDQRLITRLVGGLIVDIGTPDFETRTAILRAKCEERGVLFRAGVVDELGRLEFHNVRELQGALNRLIAVQALGGEPVSPADVLSVLGDLAEARALVQTTSRGPGEFQSFLDEIASAVSLHIDTWRPPLPGPSPTFTRAGFEVGSSNALAARAADAIVAAPGVRYNPLFLHGRAGVGKTHLMNAIGNGLIAAPGERSARVACVTAQVFVDELIAALQEGTVDQWRASYRSADALLLDDVQFLAGRERTQEELFHVFNALHTDGKQLVFVSDRPPRELASLEDRLRSRFEGGLVVEVLPPDRELRERLCVRLLQDGHREGRSDLVAYLADKPAASVRELIGTVNRVVAASELAGVAPTVEFVRGQVDVDGAAVQARPKPSDVVDPFFLNPEKVIWDWPSPAARLIEELR